MKITSFINMLITAIVATAPRKSSSSITIVSHRRRRFSTIKTLHVAGESCPQTERVWESRDFKTRLLMARNRGGERNAAKKLEEQE